jgi:NAD(P)H-hydrate epimerase
MERWLEPLHDAQTMRAVDAWAIEERGVPSLDLMEAAGRAVAEAAEAVARSGAVRVVCGKGNNGGDGLVAARHLAASGHEVEVLLLSPPDQLSADARANLDRYDGTVREFEAGALTGSGVVVDAIFGTGFEGAARDPAATAIAEINDCGAPVVAADIASGVDASNGEVAGAAVKAAVTVSFHAAKLGHWIAPGKRHTGDLRVAAIGIPDGAPGEAPGGLIGRSVLDLLEARGPDSTKFSSGTVLVVGGSRGLTGSVCLAAASAARAGAGYVTDAVPAELESIFEIKLTEQMSIGCPSEDGALVPAALDSILDAADRRAAVVLGPGIGRSDGALELARELVGRIESPLVVDADGLNALAGRLDLVAARAEPTVLTPHAGELGRLLETDSADIGAHRLAKAREAAERAGAIVALKGDDTIVAVPGEPVIVNGLSSPALATAGTGDVLGGMIGALIARGLEPRTAAAAAVHAHTRAGRAAAERIGAAESVLAGDVVESIPDALGPDRPDR